MIKIGRAILGQGPAIAVTVTDGDDPKSIQRAKKTAGAYYNFPFLIELRIDRFRRLEENYVLSKVRSFKRPGLPLIATIRSRKEGGARRLSDPERFGLFRKVLPFVDAVDIELASIRLRKTLLPLVHRAKKKIILSYHDFTSTPSEAALICLIQKGRRAGADIVKIAVTPKSKNDLTRLLRVTNRYREKNLITIAMDRLGTPSRVLAPLFGSLLTYTFIGEKSQAPGQLSLHSLFHELKPLL